MEHLFGDIYGLIHLVASIVALLTGTLVLMLRKGTMLHRQIGCAYVSSMAVLLLTSFFIYRLFDGWGVFHYATVASLITVSLGMIPIWMKRPVGKWQYMHFSFMYWSVIGLYSAFAAEVLTRVPEAPFFGMVAISFAIILLAGSIYFAYNRSRWMRLFGARK